MFKNGNVPSSNRSAPQGRSRRQSSREVARNTEPPPLQRGTRVGGKASGSYAEMSSRTGECRRLLGGGQEHRAAAPAAGEPEWAMEQMAGFSDGWMRSGRRPGPAAALQDVWVTNSRSMAVLPVRMCARTTAAHGL